MSRVRYPGCKTHQASVSAPTSVHVLCTEYEHFAGFEVWDKRESSPALRGKRNAG